MSRIANTTISPLIRRPGIGARNRTKGWVCSTSLAGFAGVALCASLALPSGAYAQGLPSGGNVAAGAASISGTADALTINQTSQNVAINWQSFDIGAGKSVAFVQPDSSSVALNRVLGSDPSLILGNLSANGKVFLVNPSGILFGKGAQVNVGGLVASTLEITDADFMAGQYRFSGSGGSVLNEGAISADGGYVALLGADVSNQGVIQARLGVVALAAGEAVTLDLAGDGLLNVTVDRGAVTALVHNGGMIVANGGHVLLTAQAAGALLKTVVNNSGVIEAQSIGTHNGAIKLMGDMQGGTVLVGGVLDASAPGGGDGGFIETSAASVNVANDARITTLAPLGKTGTWLIDPQDFTIAAGGNISGATLSALLVTNSVTISTLTGPDVIVAGTPPTSDLHTAAPGNGDINVNEAVAWVATPSTTTLTLNAVRDVNVNAAVTATNGNFVACCGRDANLNAAITTTNGSILISAGQNVNARAAMTTTDGNITLCAGRNLTISGALTLTRGSTIAAQGLGLLTGMVLIAGYDGTGPGVGGGTVIFAPNTPPVTVTGPNAAVRIDYNPVSYAAPTNFLPNFTLTNGATITQRMLVFPNGTKAFDGSTAVTLAGFNSTAASGLPAGVTLVAGPGSTATFDSAAVGTNVAITYSGYTLGGPSAANYALATACCVVTTRTTGAITPAVSPPPPPVSPPPPPVSPPPPPVSPPPPPVSPPPPPVSPPPPPTSPPPPPPITPPAIPTPTPSVVRAQIAPLMALPFVAGLPLISVSEGGVLMPPVQIAEAQPLPPPVSPVVPPYVPPAYPPKQDRH